MTDERTKLRVKLGAAEIEYEGGTEFLRAEVMPTIGKMLQMVESEADLRNPPPMLPAKEAIDENAGTGFSKGAPTLTTNTLAAINSVESASDLAIAASARLIMVAGHDPISRQQILDEMRSATAYFKKSYVNNHSNTLKMLVKADRLRSVAEDKYTLSPKERKSLEALLQKAAGHDTG